MKADTPVMIACNISRADEKRLTTRLDLLGLATRALAVDAPTLILIGEAVLSRSVRVPPTIPVEAGRE